MFIPISAALDWLHCCLMANVWKIFWNCHRKPSFCVGSTITWNELASLDAVRISKVTSPTPKCIRICWNKSLPAKLASHWRHCVNTNWANVPKWCCSKRPNWIVAVSLLHKTSSTAFTNWIWHSLPICLTIIQVLINPNKLKDWTQSKKHAKKKVSSIFIERHSHLPLSFTNFHFNLQRTETGWIQWESLLMWIGCIPIWPMV